MDSNFRGVRSESGTLIPNSVSSALTMSGNANESRSPLSKSDSSGLILTGRPETFWMMPAIRSCRSSGISNQYNARPGSTGFWRSRYNEHFCEHAMKRILVIFGTRPEAIKLCPIILSLRQHAEFNVRTCSTGQHRELLDQVLAVFRITPDHALDLMLPGQSLAQAASRILAALEAVLEAEQPDLVLVQGDTTTTLFGALAAFYQRIPVGHVEAGLRTGDLAQPFPEEMNRVVVTRLSRLHFAATEWAGENLRRDGVDPANVHVTGNSGIDAVLYVKAALESGELTASPQIDGSATNRLILVTAHRRESFGEGFERICSALTTLAERADIHIVLPVHPNPKVREPVVRLLGHCPRISIIKPLNRFVCGSDAARLYPPH